MKKYGLGVRLVFAGMLLLLPIGLVFAGKIHVLQYSSILNDPLGARTYKLVGGGGMPPVMPTEQTIEASMMADTNSPNYNYIYGHEFDDATLYPVGTNVKWKVNRCGAYPQPDGSILYLFDGVELSRGTSVAY
ncbi:MAG: hypothetical protein AABP62_11430 [Planctomycetota bacterium]